MPKIVVEEVLAVTKTQMGGIIFGIMAGLMAYFFWSSKKVYFINSIIDKDANPVGFYVVTGILLLLMLIMFGGALGWVLGNFS